MKKWWWRGWGWAPAGAGRPRLYAACSFSPPLFFLLRRCSCCCCRSIIAVLFPSTAAVSISERLLLWSVVACLPTLAHAFAAPWTVARPDPFPFPCLPSPALLLTRKWHTCDHRHQHPQQLRGAIADLLSSLLYSSLFFSPRFFFCPTAPSAKQVFDLPQPQPQ